MTTVVTQFPLSTLAVDLSGLAGATPIAFSTTELVLENSVIGQTFTFTGTDIGFDPLTNTFLGNATGFSIAQAGVGTVLSLSDFSIPLNTIAVLILTNDSAGLVAALTAGDDSFIGSSGADTLAVGGGNDSISAGGGDDSLSGSAGRDSIDGGDDNDMILGGGAADQLLGGAGNDTIRGGGGDDVITGGAGKDRLSGGAGADMFVFTAVTDSQTDRDTILDFTGADGDRIDLSAMGSLSFGDDSFDGVAGEVIARASAGGDWVVMVDIDGDSSADFRLLVKTAADLAAGDFILSAA